jgi:large subunit ribosomal protein L30
VAAKIRVTYVKSAIGYPERQKNTIRSLGLSKLNQSVEIDDTPSLRGLVEAVSHLVRVEPVDATRQKG